jgi:hypothetical protein
MCITCTSAKDGDFIANGKLNASAIHDKLIHAHGSENG